MEKTELYKQLNEKRSRGSLAPLSEEEFVTALSSMEAKGIISTLGDQVYVNAPDVEVIITEGS